MHCNTLNQLGALAYRKKDFQGCCDYLLKAREAGHVTQVNSLNLSDSLLRLGRYQQAQEVAESVVQAIDSTPGKKTTKELAPLYVLGWANVAIAQDRQGTQKTAANKSYKQAIQLGQTLLGHSHPVTVQLIQEYNVFTGKESRREGEGYGYLPPINKNASAVGSEISGEAERKADSYITASGGGIAASQYTPTSSVSSNAWSDVMRKNNNPLLNSQDGVATGSLSSSVDLISTTEKSASRPHKRSLEPLDASRKPYTKRIAAPPVPNNTYEKRIADLMYNADRVVDQSVASAKEFQQSSRPTPAPPVARRTPTETASPNVQKHARPTTPQSPPLQPIAPSPVAPTHAAAPPPPQQPTPPTHAAPPPHRSAPNQGDRVILKNKQRVRERLGHAEALLDKQQRRNRTRVANYRDASEKAKNWFQASHGGKTPGQMSTPYLIAPEQASFAETSAATDIQRWFIGIRGVLRLQRSIIEQAKKTLLLEQQLLKDGSTAVEVSQSAITHLFQLEQQARLGIQQHELADLEAILRYLKMAWEMDKSVPSGEERKENEEDVPPSSFPTMESGEERKENEYDDSEVNPPAVAVVPSTSLYSAPPPSMQPQQSQPTTTHSYRPSNINSNTTSNDNQNNTSHEEKKENHSNSGGSTPQRPRTADSMMLIVAEPPPAVTEEHAVATVVEVTAAPPVEPSQAVATIPPSVSKDSVTTPTTTPAEAAIKIQAQFRGMEGRKSATKKKNKKKEQQAAVKIQAVFRGKQGRDTAQGVKTKKRKDRKCSVGNLQSQVRTLEHLLKAAERAQAAELESGQSGEVSEEISRRIVQLNQCLQTSLRQTQRKSTDLHKYKMRTTKEGVVVSQIRTELDQAKLEVEDLETRLTSLQHTLLDSSPTTATDSSPASAPKEIIELQNILIEGLQELEEARKKVTELQAALKKQRKTQRDKDRISELTSKMGAVAMAEGLRDVIRNDEGEIDDPLSAALEKTRDRVCNLLRHLKLQLNRKQHQQSPSTPKARATPLEVETLEKDIAEMRACIRLCEELEPQERDRQVRLEDKDYLTVRMKRILQAELQHACNLKDKASPKEVMSPVGDSKRRRKKSVAALGSSRSGGRRRSRCEDKTSPLTEQEKHEEERLYGGPSNVVGFLLANQPTDSPKLNIEGEELVGLRQLKQSTNGLPLKHLLPHFYCLLASDDVTDYTQPTPTVSCTAHDWTPQPMLFGDWSPSQSVRSNSLSVAVTDPAELPRPTGEYRHSLPGGEPESMGQAIKRAIAENREEEEQSQQNPEDPAYMQPEEFSPSTCALPIALNTNIGRLRTMRSKSIAELEAATPPPEYSDDEEGETPVVPTLVPEEAQAANPKTLGLRINLQRGLRLQKPVQSEEVEEEQPEPTTLGLPISLRMNPTKIKSRSKSVTDISGSPVVPGRGVWVGTSAIDRKEDAEEEPVVAAPVESVVAVSSAPPPRKEETEGIQSEQHAATKIQAVFKGRKARKEFETRHRPAQKSATAEALSEDDDDTVAANVTKPNTELSEDAAATKIQAILRGRAARKEIETKHKPVQKSATAEALPEDDDDDDAATNPVPPPQKQELTEDAAATKIQAILRGRAARKEYETTHKPSQKSAAAEALPEDDDDNNDATSTNVPTQQTKELSEDAAATKIQAILRGRAARKECESKHKPSQKSAAAEALPEDDDDSVTSAKVTKPPQTKDLSEDAAATKIQAILRGRAARKEYESTHKPSHKASTAEALPEDDDDSTEGANPKGTDLTYEGVCQVEVEQRTDISQQERKERQLLLKEARKHRERVVLSLYQKAKSGQPTFKRPVPPSAEKQKSARPNEQTVAAPDVVAAPTVASAVPVLSSQGLHTWSSPSTREVERQEVQGRATLHGEERTERVQIRMLQMELIMEPIARLLTIARENRARNSLRSAQKVGKVAAGEKQRGWAHRNAVQVDEQQQREGIDQEQVDAFNQMYGQHLFVHNNNVVQQREIITRDAITLIEKDERNRIKQQRNRLNEVRTAHDEALIELQKKEELQRQLLYKKCELSYTDMDILKLCYQEQTTRMLEESLEIQQRVSIQFRRRKVIDKCEIHMSVVQYLETNEAKQRKDIVNLEYTSRNMMVDNQISEELYVGRVKLGVSEFNQRQDVMGQYGEDASLLSVVESKERAQLKLKLFEFERLLQLESTQREYKQHLFFTQLRVIVGMWHLNRGAMHAHNAITVDEEVRRIDMAMLFIKERDASLLEARHNMPLHELAARETILQEWHRSALVLQTLVDVLNKENASPSLVLHTLAATPSQSQAAALHFFSWWTDMECSSPSSPQQSKAMNVPL